MSPPIRALILDGHSRAALEALQALGRAGVAVHIGAESNDVLSFRSRYPQKRLKQPPAAQPDKFLDWVRQLDAQHEYALIIPATEASLLAVNRLPDSHRLRAKAVLAANRSIRAALDKQSTWKLAAGMGIPVPRSALIAGAGGAAADYGFPRVLKPVHSKITIGKDLTTAPAAVVGDAKARQAYLDAWLPHVPVQEQEYVQGHGVGIELLFAHGRMLWYFAHERLHEHPLTGGASSYRRSIVPPREMLAAARRLLEALNWHGVAMVEFKLNGNGDYRLLEINPRLWGSLALSIDAGVNFPLGLLGLAMGKPLAGQPDYRIHYYTRNLFDDCKWLQENSFADHHDPLLLTRPIVKSYLELLRPAIGKESWDHFDTGDLGVATAIVGRLLRTLAGGSIRHALTQLKHRWTSRRHEILTRRMRSGARLQKVLFICQGNICRSPFAAEYARKTLPGIDFSSAGLHVTPERGTPPHIQVCAAKFGIDLSRHRSRVLRADMIEAAELILVMDQAGYDQLTRKFPDARAKTTLLGLFHPEPTDTIEDPNALDLRNSQLILRKICDSIKGLASVVDAKAFALQQVPAQT